MVFNVKIYSSKIYTSCGVKGGKAPLCVRVVEGGRAPNSEVVRFGRVGLIGLIFMGEGVKGAEHSRMMDH